MRALFASFALFSFALLSSSSAFAAEAWPAVSSDVAPFGTGNEDAAVVAGVSKYFVLPEIKGAADNATDWFTWLTKARGVPLEHVHLLRDAEVTREQMLDAVTKAKGEVGANGTLWIIFIGHGAPAKSGDDGLLLGVDAQRTELSIEERGLPQKQFLDAAKGSQKTTLAIFDACFSGMSNDGKTPLVTGSQATLPVRRAAADNGLVVLSSSDEVAGPLPGHDRPAFSYLLLGGVRGWADKDNDATVTLDEAFGYVRSTLVSVVRDKNQTPTLRGIANNVVLAKNATERGPDLSRFIAAHDADARRPRELSPEDRARAEGEFKRVEIHRTDQGYWGRGPYNNAVSESDLVKAGGSTAPDAAAVVDELHGPGHAFAENAIMYTAIGGAVAGVALGLGAGLLFPSVDQAIFGSSANDAVYRYLAVPGMAGALGAMGTMLIVGLPVELSSDLSDSDRARLATAENDLAAAANDDERRKRGLPPLPPLPPSAAPPQPQPQGAERRKE
jgi:hypothetical protein